MKIFITGIAGFLGSQLAARMISLGHTVVGNDNLIGGYIDNAPASAKFYQIDCCDRDSMIEIIEGCDVVVHAAATAHEGLSVFSPDFITKNIFQASVSTISAAISANVKKFVFCSSMARYGNQPSPFYENMPTSPVDPYGIAKVGVEEILKNLSSVHKMQWNIVVPHNIVGPGQKYNDPFRNVASIMINRNLQKKPSIIYGDGLQQRCFSHVDDCISCLEKIILEDVHSEIINIGPDEGTVSILTLADLISEYCNFKHDYIFLPSRPCEVDVAFCSSEKARSQLGYTTTKTLQNMIEDTAEWIKKRGTLPFDYAIPLEIINEKTPPSWKNRLL